MAAKGHLFITRGNLLNLSCHAVLIPSGTRGGRRGHVTSHWRSLGLPHQDGFVTPAPISERRIVEVRRSEGDAPAVWLGHTGERGDEEPAWFAQPTANFIRSFQTPAKDGARPLLGIPVIGTGEGGMRDRKGEVVEALVEHTLSALAESDADAVIVASTAASYSALQQARARLLGEGWDALTAEQRATASELASDARNDDLVLFIGAGASVGAGLPSWPTLLDELGHRAGLDPLAREELLKLDARDAGDLIERRLKREGQSLSGVIVELMASAKRSSLVHQLLASLPVSEAVTTNYDCLFEDAWRDAGRNFARLPYESARGKSSWLLKLHGSLGSAAEEERIVLSRSDYLRFEEQGAALAGLVQAMLLTRRMLFVGYSLSDDNFHRLVHQVRDALGESDTRPGGAFGVALTPAGRKLSQEVWDGDIEFVSTAGTKNKTDSRRLSILLDYIGQQAAAPTAHLLDDSYSTLFSESEVKLRAALRAVRIQANNGSVRQPVRDAVTQLLDELAGERRRSDRRV